MVGYVLDGYKQSLLCIVLFSGWLFPGWNIGCERLDGDAPVGASSCFKKSFIWNVGEDSALACSTDLSYSGSRHSVQFKRQHLLKQVTNHDLSMPVLLEQRDEVRVGIKAAQICAVEDSDSHGHMFKDMFKPGGLLWLHKMQFLDN